ncbi:hypothetical protein PUV54_03615 [Hyphococcus flavus]|uniref:Uncharacterized protein n=1 Tax=Hyphococcus flavus TaxID=1866326 RepID=A0AAF0CGK2_9PROT|nr:hypothetical protein [Hyphococcus flavus]WDI32278.1 hypothetical protein PUV54_03615 [Hyphococcus flavus]
MTMLKDVFFLSSTCLLMTSALHAQQTLSVETVDNYGNVTLQQNALGCFDPVAALQLDKDGTDGNVSNATRRAFGVGTCVALDSGVTLSGAQKLNIEGQTLVRGAVANMDVYLPEWSAAMGASGSGSSAARAATNSLRGDAMNFRQKVAEMDACDQEAQSLNTRIADYNDRAAKFSNDSEETMTTGSRLAGGGSAPIIRIRLPDKERQTLYAEGLNLSDDVADHNNRCDVYRDGFQLDKDYMAFYRAGA